MKTTCRKNSPDFNTSCYQKGIDSSCSALGAVVQWLLYCLAVCSAAVLGANSLLLNSKLPLFLCCTFLLFAAAHSLCSLFDRHNCSCHHSSPVALAASSCLCATGQKIILGPWLGCPVTWKNAVVIASLTFLYCLAGRVLIKKLRRQHCAASIKATFTSQIDMQQLLSREHIPLDLGAVKQAIHGKTILVTGGAGSIGSEICRQVLELGCKHLVILDLDENGLFYLERRLVALFPQCRITLCVASVQNKARVSHIIQQHRPHIVYHAAAHKHVPLMEANQREAIQNNFLGTLYTAQAAELWGAERFILISSDKAVNPANIMGATKRMCELTIQAMADSSTIFAAVRFGNVLGSAGSVVPIFQEQIAAGGPVTVTHPKMERYFMTIPEAVGLVLCAGQMAHGGEIFMLDMGKPINIYELACKIIQLSGLRPHQDINITFTGLRPGEKLYEEIAFDCEHTINTENDKIQILCSKPANKSDILSAAAYFEQDLEQLPWAQIQQQVQKLVPTYHANKNCQATGIRAPIER